MYAYLSHVMFMHTKECSMGFQRELFSSALLG